MRFILFIFLLSWINGRTQSKQDTSLFKQVSIIKIERSEKVGNWITLKDNDNGEIRYLPQYNVSRKQRDMIGFCIPIGKDIWNELKTTKN